jgi:hypothetical protein
MTPAEIRRSSSPALLVVTALLVLTPPTRAQESPFLSHRTFQLLNGEVSGDAAFETIRFFTQFHRLGNSPGFTAAADYLQRKAEEFGLEDVLRLKQPVGSPAWSAQDGELWITSPVLMKLADQTDVQLMLADYSRPADLEAELVDVGEGTSDGDYDGIEVAGKVVFARGSPSAVVREAVFERGAVGIVTTALRSTGRPWDHPDQIPWQSVPRAAPQGTAADGWFGFVLSARRGDELEALLAGRAIPEEVALTGADPSGPVRVRVLVRSSFDTVDLDTEFIEARINGTDPSLPAVVFTCHIQEEKFSANDDASGCANVLEIGRAVGHLIERGMIERPKRTLRFWAANEISGPYWYFRTYPDERQRILAALHQDMVGAKQSEGSRVQHIIRSPHHQASYVADVVQSVAESVIHGNSGYLAAGQAGGTYPFSRPVYSRLGTRDGYRAEIVPNFNNSDHMVFNDGIVGIPAVGFINWPDDYIHSSDDDLWQIDPTQLKRNAFIIAASGLYLANAGAEDVPTLLAEVEGRGAERLGNDLRAAMAEIASAAPGLRSEAYKTASFILDAAEMRERRAVASITDFVEGDGGMADAVADAEERVAGDVDALRDRLGGYYRSIAGESPPRTRLTSAEQAAAEIVPVNLDDVDEYLSNRPRPSTGLTSLMTFSTWGHVDGASSYLDIYKQVMAEAKVHGAWYYGTVELDQVTRTLDAGVEAGVLRLR